MGSVPKTSDITAPLKSAEDRAKDIAGDEQKVAELIKENDRLKEPRAAELRTTEQKEGD